MQDDARLREFIRGASRLPVLPKVTARLLGVLDSPDSSTQQIAAVIQAEPALAVRILKLANSSFYGQCGSISTVRNAVIVLGAKTIRSLVLIVWTHTIQSQGKNAAEAEMLAPLLSHGLAVAVAARMLAERISRDLGEDAFMAGLLHDIGRVALVAQMGQEYRERILDPAQQEGIALHDKEMAVLGFDHRALGAALMAAWKLPPFLIDAVERHHDADIVPESQFFTATTALADSLATRLGANLAVDAPRPERTEIASFFGLGDPQVVGQFLESCLAAFTTINEVFQAAG